MDMQQRHQEKLLVDRLLQGRISESLSPLLHQNRPIQSFGMVASIPFTKLWWRLFLLHPICCGSGGFFARAFSAIPLRADSSATMNPFFGSLVDEPTVIYQEKPRRAVKRPTKPSAKRKRGGRGTTTTTLLVEAPASSYSKEKRTSMKARTLSKVSLLSNGIAQQPMKRRTPNLQSRTPPPLKESETIESPIAATKLEDMEKPLLHDVSLGTDSTEKTALAAASAEVERKQQSSSDLRPRSLRKRVATWENEMEKRKYYRTKLLTVDEEYEFGMKVQYMIRCEEVHRGLASLLERVPTFTEWAAACGFTEPCEKEFTDAHYDYLRPEGFEEMFEEVDPDHFVGNGLGHEAGPGRGCARKESPPRLRLGNWYDDSQYRAQMRAYEEDNTLPKPKPEPKKPVNRGDLTRFVEMLSAGRDAKQRMIESNMRLVVSIAAKYSRAGVGLMDLVQEGSIGLHRAASKFEPKKGFKFSTYASWWIQQAVFRSIAYNSRNIRLPVHVHNQLNSIRKVRRNLAAELRRKPTYEEMAACLGLSLKKYKYLMYLMAQTTSLDTPAYAQNPKDSYFESIDLVSDTVQTSSPEDATSAEQAVDKSLFMNDLNDILSTLDEDERIVINLRYGLRDGVCRSVTGIADTLKRSKTWVRSKECRALRKLRRPWYEKKLREYEEAFGAS